MLDWLLVHICNPVRAEVVEWPIEVRKDLGF